MKSFNLKPLTLHVFQALSIMCIAAPMFAQAQQATDLGTVSAGGGASQNPAVTAASKVAVSQGSLDARSAQSVVSDDYVRNLISPEADYSQVFLITPGAFSFSPNGVGMGNAATTVRGLSDSQYLITFDGIPVTDTNNVSHHSYVFFPGMAIGGAVVDRSPGSAATIGQGTFGGSLNMLSRNLEPNQRTSITGSYGSWDTTLGIAEFESGQFGADGRSNLLVNIQQMNSDGYQTYNHQDRQAFSAKYQYIVSPDTVITAFTSYMNVRNNQLDAGAPTRGQIAQYGDNYLNSNDPTQPNYFGYNLYHVMTNFQYVGIQSNLGNGWKVDDKLYNYGYINHENIGGNPVAAGSSAAVNIAAIDTGTDKLNSYHTTGNVFRASQESAMGILRAGLWTEYANTNRHQYPSDELTGWTDSSAPKFSETFQTTTIQPYVEYEFKVSDVLKITPGVKFSDYKQDFNHLQDLKKVGPLGGTINKTTDSITGGLPSISNSVTYHDVLPSLDAHLALRPNWTAYAQYAAGDLIPPSAVFDVPGASVSVLPKAQKSNTFQVGTVWTSNEFNLDANVYHVKLDNSYTCNTDPNDTANSICAGTGTETTQGFEIEGTWLLGHGLSIYGNGTIGTTKYTSGALDGTWVAAAPGNTETLGLFYKDGPWDAATYVKRIGKVYNDGLNPGDGAYVIDPVVLTNLFANYTFKLPGNFAKQAKVQLAINNLFGQNTITGISGNKSSNPALNTGKNAYVPAADLITELPGRSTTLSITVDF